jgi:molecular chaperone Hsp33
MDIALGALSEDGGFLVRSAVTTLLCEEARRRHECSPTATAALGRALTGSLLLGSLLKDARSILLQWRGGGPLGPVVAEGRPELTVRGYVANPGADVPSRGGKIDVGGGVGVAGSLVVVKDHGLREPYTSTVPLQTGEIGDDLAFYLLMSEQIPSAVALGVHVRPDYSVSAAGGILVEALPGADAEATNRIIENFAAMGSVTEHLRRGQGAEGLIALALRGVRHRVWEEGEPRFFCPCGPRRLDVALSALPPQEIEEQFEMEGEIKVRCGFCAAEWRKGKGAGHWERRSRASEGAH